MNKDKPFSVCWVCRDSMKGLNSDWIQICYRQDKKEYTSTDGGKTYSKDDKDRYCSDEARRFKRTTWNEYIMELL